MPKRVKPAASATLMVGELMHNQNVPITNASPSQTSSSESSSYYASISASYTLTLTFITEMALRKLSTRLIAL
jgi:hypothetical protein